MPILSSLVTLAVCLAGCAGDDPYAELRAELIEMGRIDQEVRIVLMDSLDDTGQITLPDEEFRRLDAELDNADEANFLRLEEIVNEHGWPGTPLVGEDASHAAWLILEHANIERQKRFLPMLREAAAENRALAFNLAGIEDEIAIADTGEQIYGTEISMVDGVWFLVPVADPAGLDERRAAVGLPPMEDYLELAESQLGVTIDRSNLTTD